MGKATRKKKTRVFLIGVFGLPMGVIGFFLPSHLCRWLKKYTFLIRYNLIGLPLSLRYHFKSRQMLVRHIASLLRGSTTQLVITARWLNHVLFSSHSSQSSFVHRVKSIWRDFYGFSYLSATFLGFFSRHEAFYKRLWSAKQWLRPADTLLMFTVSGEDLTKWLLRFLLS